MRQDANYQKIKLLKLMEFLRQETDEEHPLTTNQICEKLVEMNISCDRRTLSKDIEMLNEHGFEVMSCRISYDKAYYVEDRSFNLAEIKILLDAVQAASFITEKKSAELTDKLCALAGSHRAEVMKGNLVCFNTQKHTNESVYVSVDTIARAIEEKKQVSFLYFDLNENGERVFRKDKERYVVDSMALVFENDNYYLMTYSHKHKGIANYRIDRMYEVRMEDSPVCPEAMISMDGVSDYTTQVFSMYGGEATDVVLEFDSELAGVIYDKFGENTRMMRMNEKTLIATVRVQVSPTFWGWLFQFAGRMRLISPQPLVEQYKERARLISD